MPASRLRSCFDLMSNMPLLAVPNVSEGRESATIAAIGRAFLLHGTTRLLNVHSDSDHHRSVFTLAGAQGGLSAALLDGVRAAVERIDVGEGRAPADVGVHPHVGAVDVVPLVYLSAQARGAACAEALVVAEQIGDGLGVPVLLYGELAQGRTRANLRRGGVGGLGQRLDAGELCADFGPSRLHPTAGATLVAAREPLVAFNLELAAPADMEDARRIASLIRDGGAEGLAGVRAIGVPLRAGVRSAGARPIASADSSLEDSGSARRLGDSDSARGRHTWASSDEVTGERTHVSDSYGSPVAQVSMNVERPLEVPLRVVVEAVRRHAEVACGELVGLAPRAAFDGFPADVPLVGFDAEAHVIENALGF
jgi:glutamate formiminotransferase / 5-formyltetrahydrofolate cyclo-ligase